MISKTEIDETLRETEETVRELTGALTLAQEKLDKLKMVGRGFEILEARMTSVLPMVEEMRELLSSVNGEKEVDKTRLWEVLDLEDGGFKTKNGIRLLVDNWPVVEKVYGVVEGELVSIKSRIEGLLTAVDSGIEFDDLKTVFDGQVREMVAIIGSERLPVGRDKVTRFAEIGDVDMNGLVGEIGGLRDRLRSV